MRPVSSPATRTAMASAKFMSTRLKASGRCSVLDCAGRAALVSATPGSTGCIRQAIRGTVAAEIVRLAIDDDQSEVLRLEAVILGDAASGHGCGLPPARKHYQ